MDPDKENARAMKRTILNRLGHLGSCRAKQRGSWRSQVKETKLQCKEEKLFLTVCAGAGPPARW